MSDKIFQVDMPIYTPVRGTNRCLLVEPLEISENTVLLPGFESDGATIPWMVQHIIATPFDPMIARGAFAHDGGYQAYWEEKGPMDSLFKRLIIEDGIESWRAHLALRGVRAFGWHYHHRLTEFTKFISRR